MHARQIGPLNLGAKPYVRKKSQIVLYVRVIVYFLPPQTGTKYTPVRIRPMRSSGKVWTACCAA